MFFFNILHEINHPLKSFLVFLCFFHSFKGTVTFLTFFFLSLFLKVAALLEKMKPDEGANVMEMAEPVFEYYDKDKDGIIVLSELLPRDEL